MHTAERVETPFGVGLVDDESKLMLQINGGGKNTRSISADERRGPRLIPAIGSTANKLRMHRILEQKKQDPLLYGHGDDCTCSCYEAGT